MRLLVDECVGPAVVEWLRDEGHDVLGVHEFNRGLADEAILAKAVADEYVLITCDKDFGELVRRVGRPHRGVVLLRLGCERARERIAAIRWLLRDYAERIPGALTVVTEKRIRFAPWPDPKT